MEHKVFKRKIGGNMFTKIVGAMKILVFSYLVTGILLLLLSFGLYKFGLSNWQVTAGIIVTYALSTFLGGYLIGKRQSSRKLFWGILFGFAYFVILIVASLIMNKGLSTDYTAMIRTAAICMASGGIGGFLNNM